jgi:hypothetical protein
MIIFVLYVSNVFHRKLAVLIPLYFIVLLAVHYVRANRLKEKGIRKELEENEKRIMLRCLLKSDDELRDLLDLPDLYVIRSMHPDESDVIEAILSGAKVIGVSERTTEMEEVASLSEAQVSLVDLKEKVFAHQSTPRKRKTNNIITNTAGHIYFGPNAKYYVLGAILFALSFLVKYKIYYRTATAVCLVLAGFFGVLGRLGRGKIFLEFLDKKGHR